MLQGEEIQNKARQSRSPRSHCKVTSARDDGRDAHAATPPAPLSRPQSCSPLQSGRGPAARPQGQDQLSPSPLRGWTPRTGAGRPPSGWEPREASREEAPRGPLRREAHGDGFSETTDGTWATRGRTLAPRPPGAENAWTTAPPSGPWQLPGTTSVQGTPSAFSPPLCTWTRRVARPHRGNGNAAARTTRPDRQRRPRARADREAEARPWLGGRVPV